MLHRWLSLLHVRLLIVIALGVLVGAVWPATGTADWWIGLAQPGRKGGGCATRRRIRP